VYRACPGLLRVASERMLMRCLLHVGAMLNRPETGRVKSVTFDHEVSLGRFVNLPRAFVVMAFAMTSPAAHAGELGPTSGGTVSISITVRPQVEVSLLRDQPGNRTCVLAKGIEPSYRTMLVSGDGMPMPAEAGGGSAQLNLPACDGNLARPAAAASYASYRSAARSNAPMILLIIPD
jgi:hypothetical protein